VIYDERDEGEQPFVIIELPHADIYASDTADVEVYRHKLAALRQSALQGPNALAFMQSTQR
jgi:hypothetical protein